MAQIKILQYIASDVPREIAAKLIKLDPNAPMRDRSFKPANKHILTLESGKSIIGYALLSTPKDTSAFIETVLIHSACRGNRFGTKLLEYILKKVSGIGSDAIALKCQKEQTAFFQHLGFSITSEPRKNSPLHAYSMENPCISHYLSTLNNATQDISPAEKRQILTLGEDRHHYSYHEQAQFIGFHRSMLAQAQRQIWIVSDKITSPVFKDEYIRRSFLNLSKRNAQANIRILLEDDKTGSGSHNSLIELSQKLTSFIQIRVIPKGTKKLNEMITTVDFDAGIFRKDLNSYTGFANYNNHMIAQRLRDNFEQHWQYAKPSLEFRRLSI
jgi:predicted GNAT family N-acyltransferase